MFTLRNWTCVTNTFPSQEGGASGVFFCFFFMEATWVCLVFRMFTLEVLRDVVGLRKHILKIFRQLFVFWFNLFQSSQGW